MPFADTPIIYPLCRCRNCGLNFFLQTGFNVGLNGSLGFSNCQTTCPRCRKAAEILSGSYEVKDGNIREYLYGIDDFQTVRFRLQEALKENQRQANAEKLLKALEGIVPKAVPEARQIFQRGGLNLLISFIVLILSACDAHIDIHLTGNINQAVDQANVAAGGKPYFPEAQRRIDVEQPSSMNEEVQGSDRNQKTSDTNSSSESSKKEATQIPHHHPSPPKVLDPKPTPLKKMPTARNAEISRRDKCDHRRRFGKSRSR